jgi:hypothetical protein
MDVEAALALARELELRDHLPPAGIVELARIHHRAGRQTACLDQLERLHKVDLAVETAAAALRKRCED